jgi:hypothetical protein
MYQLNNMMGVKFLVVNYILFLKQRFVITHQYRVLQEREREKKKTYTKQTKSYVCYAFLKIQGQAIGCRHNILTEGVFVTQLSSNVGIFV